MNPLGARFFRPTHGTFEAFPLRLCCGKPLGMENTKQPTLADLKKMLPGHFAPSPLIYWTDFLASTLVGYLAFYLTEQFPLYSLPQALCFVTSLFALYRAALFTHELTHQSRKDLPGFSYAWNLLIGIPALIPSFMYRGVHIDHHKRSSYSTEEDGEYIPFGRLPFWRSLAYIASSLFLPFLLVIRFGILGPLSLLHPFLRKEVMGKASALAIRFDAVRKIPDGIDLRHWYVQEFLCFLYVLGAAYLFMTGILSPGTFVHYYVLMVSLLVINATRTVVAHRYTNTTGKELPFEDQLLDSVNIDGSPVVGVLLAPVGLRFHGLHHLFPSMPYHSLPSAHRILVEKLPADSFYHQMNEPSILSALHTLWRNTRAAKQEQALS